MLSTRDLAYEILRKARKPMHYREITGEILKKKKFRGLTPEYTVLSCLLTDRKKRFIRVRKGIYALSANLK